MARGAEGGKLGSSHRNEFNELCCNQGEFVSAALYPHVSDRGVVPSGEPSQELGECVPERKVRAKETGIQPQLTAKSNKRLRIKESRAIVQGTISERDIRPAHLADFVAPVPRPGLWPPCMFAGCILCMNVSWMLRPQFGQRKGYRSNLLEPRNNWDRPATVLRQSIARILDMKIEERRGRCLW